jgi:hypothetical protein
MIKKKKGHLLRMPEAIHLDDIPLWIAAHPDMLISISGDDVPLIISQDKAIILSPDNLRGLGGQFTTA